MKTMDTFKTTIQRYLEEQAKTDELFAVTFAKEGKNIDDCITYIMNTVKNSGCSGFADEEIYNMAVHYYDEDDIKVGGKISAKVIVNHSVELNDEEKQQAKDAAKERIIKEEMERLKGKAPKQVRDDKEVKHNKGMQTSLLF